MAELSEYAKHCADQVARGVAAYTLDELRWRGRRVTTRDVEEANSSQATLIEAGLLEVREDGIYATPPNETPFRTFAFPPREQFGGKLPRFSRLTMPDGSPFARARWRRATIKQAHRELDGDKRMLVLRVAESMADAASDHGFLWME